MDQFGFGHASGGNWNTATSACITQLVLPAGANLGFVYVTDGLAGDLGQDAKNALVVLVHEQLRVAESVFVVDTYRAA